MSSIYRSCCPLHERSILIEICDVAQPLRAALGIHDNNIWNVTWSYTAADRKLYTLQQATPTPLLFQPIGRYFGTVFPGCSAATSLADDELTDHTAFGLQHLFIPHRSLLEYNIVEYISRFEERNMSHPTENKVKMLGRVRRIRGQVDAIERALD